MSVTRTGTGTGAKAQIPMLAPPLAALLYPFALNGFNASVTRIPEGAAGAFALSWLSAAMYLALAFATPLIGVLAAMSLSGIGRPTATQLRAKRAALLAVAAPTLFTFARRRSLHASVAVARHEFANRVRCRELTSGCSCSSA